MSSPSGEEGEVVLPTTANEVCPSAVSSTALRSRSRSHSPPSAHKAPANLSVLTAAAASLLEIKDLVTRYATSFDEYHCVQLSSFCVRFAEQDKPLASALCCALAQRLVAHGAPPPSTRACCILLESCVKCGCTSAEVFPHLAMRVTGEAQSLSPAICASLLQRLAPHLGSAMLMPLLIRVANTSSALSPSRCSGVLQCMAILHLCDPALVHPIASAAVAHASALTVEHIAHCISNLSDIGDVGRPFMAPLLLEAVQRQAAGTLTCQPSALALLLRAAVLHVDILDCATIDGLIPIALSGLMHLERMSSSNAAMTMNAAAQLGLVETVRQPLAALCQQAAQLDARAVSQVLQALDTLKVREAECLEPVLARTTQLAQGGLKPGLALHFLRCLRQLQVSEAAYLEPLLACTLGGLDAFTHREIGSLLAALGAVSPHPFPAALLQDIEARGVWDLMEPKQSAAAAWAISCFRVAGGPLGFRCAQTELAQDVALLRRLCARALEAPLTQMTETTAAMLLQAHFSLPICFPEYRSGTGGAAAVTPEQALFIQLLGESDLERCSTVRELHREATTPSILQKQFFEVLQGLVGRTVQLEGGHVAMEHRDVSSGREAMLIVSAVEYEVELHDKSGTHHNLWGVHTADILVRFTGTNRCLVVEVDGPSHFFTPVRDRTRQYQPTSGTLLRNRIVQQAGCEYIITYGCGTYVGRNS